MVRCSKRRCDPLLHAFADPASYLLKADWEWVARPAGEYLYACSCMSETLAKRKRKIERSDDPGRDVLNPWSWIPFRGLDGVKALLGCLLTFVLIAGFYIPHGETIISSIILETDRLAMIGGVQEENDSVSLVPKRYLKCRGVAVFPMP